MLNMKTIVSDPIFPLLIPITQAVMLVAVLAFGSVALAQQRAILPVTELQTLGKEGTVRFKDGQVLTYQQLAGMTKAQQDTARDKINKNSEWDRFQEWELDTINAQNDELDKNLAALNARNDELDKNLAALNARADELDNQLISSALLLIKHGKSLNKNDKGFYEELATKKPNDRRIKEILSRAKFE